MSGRLLAPRANSDSKRRNEEKFRKNSIGVQSWMAAQSKLWKFEWSERGIV